jgi:hypothetical protein
MIFPNGTRHLARGLYRFEVEIRHSTVIQEQWKRVKIGGGDKYLHGTFESTAIRSDHRQLAIDQ